MAWTTDDLVTDVRERGRFPDGSAVASDTSILGIAYQELLARIEPALRRARGNYRVRTVDQALVAGQSEYRIPSWAQGATARDVVLVDANGNEIPCPWMPLEDRGRYTSRTSPWWPHGVGHAISGDHVVVLPTPVSTGSSLRIRAYRRPGRFVPVSEAALIDDVSAAPVYSVTAAGEVDDGDLVDVIQAAPNFDWLAVSVAAGVAGTDVTLPAAVDGVAVGDYIVEAGKSPVVQLPDAFHPALTMATVAAVQQAVGNVPASDAAGRTRDEFLVSAIRQVTPRNEGASRIVKPRYSLFGGGRR